MSVSDNLDRLVELGKIEGKRPRGRTHCHWCDQLTVLTGLREGENQKMQADVTRCNEEFSGIRFSAMNNMIEKKRTRLNKGKIFS